jgi:hypothetical protein
MWKLYLTSKATHSRPSSLLCVDDPLVAYQFDAAVTAFGTVIENALHERVEVGSGKFKRYVARYELRDLLADGFQFPRVGDDLAVFRQIEGYEEVRA